MKLKKFAACAISSAIFMMPLSVLAQESHEAAKAQVERHDARHHNKAKIVGGSAVGGALIGAKVGGPGGAIVGAGIGAGGGLIANKIRKHHSIKKRERHAHPHQY